MDFKKWFEEIRSTEDGRSMTEMLGVLAIIGVLSIGGISSYKYAIDTHYGNEIMNNLNLMAVSFESQLISDPFLDSFTNEFNFGQYGITVDAYPSDDMGEVLAVGDEAEFFTVELGGMTADVCRQVLRNMEQRDDVYILIGNEEFDGDNLDVCDNLDVATLWKNPFVKGAYAATQVTTAPATTAPVTTAPVTTTPATTTPVTTTPVTTTPVTTTPVTTTPVTTTPVTTTPVTTTAVTTTPVITTEITTAPVTTNSVIMPYITTSVPAWVVSTTPVTTTPATTTPEMVTTTGENQSTVIPDGVTTANQEEVTTVAGDGEGGSVNGIPMIIIYGPIGG